MISENITIFTPAAHQDVLAIIMQIAVLLLTARVFGEIAQRLRQPSVIGEILAGIILGPSIIGHFFPQINGYIIPGNATQGHLLEAVSLIGAIFLLLITGLETDLKLIRRHAKTALTVATGGLVLPLLTGFILGQFLPDYLLADPDKRIIFSMFIATAMSISAIPVISKVLIDLKLMRRDIGQTIIAAGMTDDTAGWILLSVVVGLAAGEVVSAQSVLLSIGSVVGFIVFNFTCGWWMTQRILNYVQDKAKSPNALLTLVVVMAFLWGSITHALHFEAVLGAFMMGILFGQMRRLPQSIHKDLNTIALGIFAPIFFAVAGLKVNIAILLKPNLLIITLIVITVACLGKILGTYIGAKYIIRKDHWTALSFGAALNARGAMEIIVATIGLSSGILTQEMFSIIVVMAMTTSLLAPSALRWILQHITPSEEEAQRLQQEDIAEGSAILNIHRILMPVRYREKDDHLQAMQVIKSKILHNMGLRNKLSLTLLCIESKVEKTNRMNFLESISPMFKEHELIRKIVESKNTSDEVLKESEKDYDMLVLGASKQHGRSEFVFSKVVDDLIRLAPCTTMIVHANKIPENWSPFKILVPTNGSYAARNAVELAFMIAATGRETVKILNVIERDTKNIYEHLNDENFRRRLKIAADMLKPLKKLGDLKGVPTEIDAVPGPSTEKIILDVANTDQADLIIIGTDIRPASERLFLGPQIEYILKHASCPVIALNVS